MAQCYNISKSGLFLGGYRTKKPPMTSGWAGWYGVFASIDARELKMHENNLKMAGKIAADRDLEAEVFEIYKKHFGEAVGDKLYPQTSWWCRLRCIGCEFADINDPKGISKLFYEKYDALHKDLDEFYKKYQYYPVDDNCHTMPIVVEDFILKNNKVRNYLRDKIIVSNCDDYNSGFSKVFVNTFDGIYPKAYFGVGYNDKGMQSFEAQHLGGGGLIYEKSSHATEEEAGKVKIVKILRGADGHKVVSEPIINSSGDFTSDEVKLLVSKSDVVVTMPPAQILPSFINCLGDKPFILLIRLDSFNKSSKADKLNKHLLMYENLATENGLCSNMVFDLLNEGKFYFASKKLSVPKKSNKVIDKNAKDGFRMEKPVYFVRHEQDENGNQIETPMDTDYIWVTNIPELGHELDDIDTYYPVKEEYIDDDKQVLLVEHFYNIPLDYVGYVAIPFDTIFNEFDREQFMILGTVNDFINDDDELTERDDEDEIEAFGHNVESDEENIIFKIPSKLKNKYKNHIIIKRR